MNNPKKDTKKTITELKNVAGGALAATVDSVGGHSPGNPSPAPGVELAGVVAGATAPTPYGGSEPQLPQYTKPDLAVVAAGATAATYGSIGDSSPQIPEVFPAPSPSRIQGQGPSMQELNNVVAGATAPGANIGDSGPALPNKPQFSIGATATQVSVADLSNVAAGATAPGADISGSGPALPKKPQFQIGPGSSPVQTDNADVI